MSLNVVSSFNGVTDPDAGAYIAAVEAADGQLLEFAVGKAINDFVVGCKADGIWDAIKASCILAGARTRLGALIPLKGSAPNSFNFVDGDYNRKTGLLGDGTTKYLSTNRANNADPQNSKHISVYLSQTPSSTGSFQDYISAATGVGNTGITRASAGTSGSVAVNNDNTNATLSSSAINTVGFIGASRSNGSEFISRALAANTTNSLVSATPASTTITVFRRGSASSGFSNGAFAFYSIGEAIDLAKLDARVTLLMAGIQAGVDGYDPDAQAYISAVEIADNQPLEFAVKSAINQFVVGCKQDGIWSAIKASCILAGARTLNGALVPLAGTAPTNFNFVSGDYNRKTGLVGNGSTKYLNSNRNNNADPQDNQHLACYATVVGTSLAMSMLASSSATGASHIGQLNVRSRNSAPLGLSMSAGLNGISRSASSSYVQRVSNASTTITQTSETPANDSIAIFRSDTFYGTHRLAFYSIGESLDLARLDSRVTDLITAFGAAIP